MTTAVAATTLAPGRPIRVVIADDSDALRTLIRFALDDADGIEVVAEAADGAEAVAIVDAVRPDVVLLDVAMPVMDGLEALTELRRRLPTVPVVMHSGFSEGVVAARALARGASAYVEKSGDLSELVAAVRQAAATSPPPSLAPVQPASAPVPDPPARHLGGDPSRPEAAAPAAGDGAGAVLSSTWIPLTAVAVFLGVYLARAQFAVLASGNGALYVLPVTLLAIRYRLAGGFVGSALASTLYAIQAQHDGPAGFEYGTRLLAYLTVGVTVGLYAERAARLSAARMRDEAALVAANRRLAETTAGVRAANEALDASNAELRQFGYVASHDLAEPLRTMGGFAQLLATRYRDTLDETGQGYLTQIVAGSARMMALIDDLRAYTTAGQQDLTRTAVAFDDVVTDVRTVLGATLAERQAHLDTSGPLPVVSGDRSMLTLVLQNLISNAVKFNQSSCPTVLVRGRVVADTGVIEISDNGIGIPVDQQERVFALFRRLHTAREYPGTGLGLAICERIVRRHGGTIALTSAPGVGSTFAITLPVAEGDRACSPSADATTPLP